MGVAAAVGVAIAVLIALTLLPALLGFFGDGCGPRQKTSRRGRRPSAARARRPARAPAPGAAPGRSRPALGPARHQVPVLTVVLVLVPWCDGLPGQGPADRPAQQRDRRPGHARPGHVRPGGEHFGQGYNGPLIVAATIVGSDDPLGVMDGMADELRALPGVASVPLATPNEDADTGIIQVIPTGRRTARRPSSSSATSARWSRTSAQYGVATAVTGFTAVGIDISDRLGAALVPFGILVVGLSLVLLTMVFRSVWVPVKATVGFLLSVGAAFGATAMVFEYGWFGSVFNVDQTAPVISFLPILLMGILFGLAMDYEVFLVSRMREEYVHGVARAGGPSRRWRAPPWRRASSPPPASSSRPR